MSLTSYRAAPSRDKDVFDNNAGWFVIQHDRGRVVRLIYGVVPVRSTPKRAAVTVF